MPHMQGEIACGASLHSPTQIGIGRPEDADDPRQPAVRRLRRYHGHLIRPRSSISSSFEIVVAGASRLSAGQRETATTARGEPAAASQAPSNGVTWEVLLVTFATEVTTIAGES
jgi:hypothetical protein